MQRPKSLSKTIARLAPSIILLPLQLILRGRKGLFFRHPFSTFQGRISVGRFSEIASFCHLNASETGINIGAYSQINSGCTLVGAVSVGDRVLIAPGCVLASGGHRFGRGITTRFSGSKFKGPLVIGDDVWIGANVTLVGPINIGSGSVIAAGLTIDSDIPAQTLVKRGHASYTTEEIR